MAEFNREHCWSDDTKDFTKYASLKTYHSQNFTNFANNFVDSWDIFHNKILDQCSNVRCHFIRYEDLKNDLIQEMDFLLRFLGFQMDSALETCLLNQSKGNFKREERSGKEKENIFNMFTTDILLHFTSVYAKFANKVMKI